MRKLAPMFVMTSIVALVGGNALANMNDKTTTTTSAATTTNASPTVSPNTSNPQGLSYSDKSNTSPGTNAVMDDKAKPSVASTSDEDKDLHKTKKKVRKAKLAARTDTAVKSDTVKSDAMKSDASVSASPMTSTNPPTKTTDPAAANSSTGRSTGQ